MSPWKSGPPPSRGWWPTRVRANGCCVSDRTFLRWWDGRTWSVRVSPHSPAEWAASAASLKTLTPNLVVWKARPKSWPERSHT